MKLELRSISIAAVLVIGIAGTAHADKNATASDTLKWAEKHFSYVGENSCKMCHKLEYDSWAKTKHATAWAALKPDEQAKPECAACHITGKTKTDSLLVNVGCESCHGPGSSFKSMATMKDPKLAAAAGLLPVTEATCVRCHNERSPQFKGFDFAKAVVAGVHQHKPKTGTK